MRDIPSFVFALPQSSLLPTTSELITVNYYHAIYIHLAR